VHTRVQPVFTDQHEQCTRPSYTQFADAQYRLDAFQRVVEHLLRRCIVRAVHLGDFGLHDACQSGDVFFLVEQQHTLAHAMVLQPPSAPDLLEVLGHAVGKRGVDDERERYRRVMDPEPETGRCADDVQITIHPLAQNVLFVRL
jgi:hypothetical protein